MGHRGPSQAKHAAGESFWGVDGVQGELVDMREAGVWDAYEVKVQTLKTSIESACMLLRIDDIVSGSSRKQQ